jgi:enoyl-CoA hydratase/carnithine racemase
MTKKTVAIHGDLVQLEIEDDVVAVLTLNDPTSRNSLSDEMIEALAAAREQIDAQESLRVLIVTGAGECFSAGGNMDDMLLRRGMFSAQTPFEGREHTMRIMHRIPALIYDIQIPTIAAVNGAAIGGGCDAALMCDIRIASPDAVFSEAFLRVGLIPGDGGAWFLPRIVGMSRAMQMSLTSEMVDADEAYRIGLVSQVVPSEELLPAARALARKIASQPPYATRLTKRLVRYGAQSSLPDTLEMSANMQAQALVSDEHRQAVNKLAERLRPKTDA